MHVRQAVDQVKICRRGVVHNQQLQQKKVLHLMNLP